MKFSITRTSVSNDQIKPCERAVKGVVLHTERMTCTEELFDKKHSYRVGKWRSFGKNHRVSDSGIQRDFERVCFIVEVNSLEELINFIHEIGEPIIVSSSGAGDTPSIEIYDDRRED